MKINRNAAAARFCTLEYGNVFTFRGQAYMVVREQKDVSANAVNLETFILTEFINDALVIPHPNASLTLHDNVLDDMKETKPTRDPRQDLKIGEHVRFEIEGIIKERQSGGILQAEDGSDFELIQYAVKDSINGMTYYVGYHQIIKVIGKEV